MHLRIYATVYYPLSETKMLAICVIKQIIETHTSFDMSRKSKSKDQTKALNIPFTLTQWDLVQEVLVSLSLSQWKVLCGATQVVDDLIGRMKDGEPVDWRYHLGEDVYFIIKAPQLTIHIRKHFVPNGEWTLHPTKIGVTLSLYEWKELKKTIPLFEDREPELTIDNV